jgi:serine/threonine protein phosphatase 1
MAIYVTSDAHGHLCALMEALGAAHFTEADELYVLGDMIDRGPDPLGVITFVRSMPNAHVIMGNHEELMLEAIEKVGNPVQGAFNFSDLESSQFMSWMDWMNNGGATTSEQLARLSEQDYDELLGWVRGLERYACVRAGERTYALVHAGIDAVRAGRWLAAHPEADASDPEQLAALLADQSPESLSWIREEFWGYATELVNADGVGPVIVAGHTPSPYLANYVDEHALECATFAGQGKVTELGACEQTGGVADRIDIDCAAACGYGMGRVGVMRLDDHQTWYAEVREGE